MVQNVGGGVGSFDRIASDCVHCRLNRVSFLQFPRDHLSVMDNQLPASLGIRDFESAVGGFEPARVADLTAAFSIKRSPVENDSNHLVGRGGNTGYQAVFFWLPNNDPLDLS